MSRTHGRSSLVLTFFTFAAVVTTFVIAGSAPESGLSSRYGIEASLTPVDGAEATFRCEVTITDLQSGEIVSRPTLVSSWGDEAIVEQANGEDSRIKIATLVSKDGARAEVAVELVKSGEVIARNRTKIDLPR